MAKTHHKPDTGTPTTQSRRYIVGYVRDHIKHQPSPSITLRGHWMGALEFKTGRKVEVSCQQGELIIRLAEG
ncbi:type I toxin-antitoxin system SymE family toxin [Rosenbergiella epipactidis]|uniref:SymE family type I addiction module toxin n=1 Tax=Rosenbergiella epipactidis TaxID=1544694 RepID=UPI002026B3C7|nr:SymE family type I addiction module toxin [Rosenbergiella epipactidis]MCL9666956.1 type I toxin-antitoxin system SymE family toxin [Rosenbergiella epipactidis]